jgi:hypothetical protein
MGAEEAAGDDIPRDAFANAVVHAKARKPTPTQFQSDQNRRRENQPERMERQRTEG